MLTELSKILSRVVIRSQENLMNLCGIILVNTISNMVED